MAMEQFNLNYVKNSYLEERQSYLSLEENK
jgi:hypothetical protein